jgi:glycosyltransferase involved in cell wall biosynthesis
MRIAIAARGLPPFVGGSEGYAGRLAEGLAGRGHEVRVVTTDHPARPPRPYRVHALRRLPLPGLPFVVWPGLLRPSLIRAVAACDVLHAINFTSFGAVAWLLIGRLYRRPVVLTAFYHPPHATAYPTASAMYDRVAGRLLAGGYDAVIVHSAAETRQLRRHVTARPGAPLRQLTCPPIVGRAAPRGGFRQKYGLRGRFVVLYVGGDEPHGGVQTLLQAAAEIVAERRIPDLALALVGPRLRPGGHALGLERLYARLDGIAHRLGPVPEAELAASYAESDVVVVPSAYESYGLVAVESLAHGTPVISTRTGAAVTFVRPGETGYLFDHGDVPALKRHLIRLRARGATMRPAAAAAVAHLSWERTVDDTVAVYREAIAARSARAGRR